MGLGARAGSSPRPDLIEATVSNRAVTKEPGQRFRVKDTVENQGRAKAARSTSRFYLSIDEGRGPGDIRIGVRRIPRLPAGGSDAGAKTVTVPADTPAGEYFVLACADDRKLVAESREKNNCTASPRTIRVEVPDTTPPPAPTIEESDPSFGAPHNDNDPEISGSAPDSATVSLFRNADCSGEPAATGSSAEFEGAGITLAVDSDEATTISARSVDAAGNQSPCSAPMVYLEDSTAPSAPQIEGSTPSFSTPRNDNDPELFGTAESGSTVTLYKSNDCSGGAAATGDAATFHEPGLTVQVGDDTETAISATATDAAGNVSDCSDPVTYEEDSTPPQVPEIEGSSPTYDTPQNDNEPEIFGVSPADAVTINLFANDDCSGVASATGSPQEFENQGISLNVPDDSTTIISATATDSSSNETACSSSITYVEDSTAPVAAVIEGSTPSNDQPRNDNDPEIYGTAPAGTTVRLYTSLDCSGEPVASGTAEAFVNGITVHVDDDTTTTIRATSGDEAGNESPCSAGFTYTEDSPIPFEVEPNDAITSAMPLAGKTPKVRGSVAPKEDVDFFSVTVPVGGSLTAETYDTSGAGCSEIDTELRLFDENATRLVFDDDDGIASCSKIDGATDAAARNLEPGIYYLSVESWQNQEPIGIYQLDVVITPAPAESEPNDSSGTATPVSSRYVRGAVQPVGDEDFYSFTVPDDGRVVAETFDSSGASCDDRNTLLRLYASDGTTEIATDDDSGIGTCSLIDGDGQDDGARHLEGGTYYLSVEDSGNNSAIKGYVLRIETKAGATPEVEPNDDVAQAGERANDPAPVKLTGDDRIAAGISPFGDKDFFQVDLTAPSVVRLETFDESGSDCPTPHAMTMRVFDSGGTPRYADSGSGVNACAALVVPLPAGISYVSVEETGNDATIADYVLEMDVLKSIGTETEPNDSRNEATPAAGTDFTVSGQHQTPSDIDFFAITVPAGGGSLRAEVVEAAGGESCESGGLDSLLTLYGPSGGLLVNDDDDGRSLCSQIDGTGSTPKDTAAHDLPAGTYYLSVEACPSPSCQIGARGQFDYRLAVTIR